VHALYGAQSVAGRDGAHPREYAWSSYRANAEGKADVLIGAHSPYCRLGRIEGERHAAYRALVKGPLDAQMVEWIRECTNKGWTLGSGRFQSKAERLAEHRATPLPKGRPKKNGQN
jgi:putative transposase